LVYVGWRLYSYPGGWTFAFGKKHTAERQGLSQARQQVRELERDVRRELSAAQARVESAKTQRQQRIRAAERQLGELRQPGRGELVGQLGELVLHRHALLVTAEEIPLAGLQVRFEQGRQKGHVYVTESEGKVRYVEYPHALHEEGVVRRFTVRIENTVAEENAFRKNRRSRIKDLESELQQAQADTAPYEAARLQLAQLNERQRQDGRLTAARSELEAAHERWQALSGHRPH
jgi:chromosome segregation ATPase